MQNANENQTLTPDTPAYNEAMAARFREARGANDPVHVGGVLDASAVPDLPAADPAVAAPPAAPQGVPAKFVRPDGSVDIEGMARSYAELERQRGTPKPAEAATPAPAGEEEAAAAGAATSAGLSYDTLVTKVQTQGDLDEADYAALAKAGVPREAVAEYITLRNERAEQSRNEALAYGGGEAATNDLLNWASQNLSVSEIEGYNALLGGPNWKAAIDTLKATRAAKARTANEPRLTAAAGGAGASATGYASRDERRVDMSNPIYMENTPRGEAFRAEVARKSLAAGWGRR